MSRTRPAPAAYRRRETVISSAPDGYTLALLSNGTAVSVSLFKKLPFDPLRDFEPISSLGFFDFRFLRPGAGSEFKTAGRIYRRGKSQARHAQCRDHQYRQHPETCRPSCSRPRPASISPSSPIGRHPRSRSALLQGDIALMIDSYSSMKGNLADNKFPGAGIVGSGALGKYA